MSYAVLYNTIFIERNVGNIQATVSLFVAMFSFGLGVLRLWGTVSL